jgi:hypothetical protein
MSPEQQKAAIKEFNLRKGIGGHTLRRYERLLAYGLLRRPD